MVAVRGVGRMTPAESAERARLVAALRRIAGGPAQQAICEGPTRRMEHIMGQCLHCIARDALASFDAAHKGEG